ncbi:neuropeptide S receptor-like [Dreissena polymorpha]|uniref:neuropeptide S receptor-like n=1 Tax=Dreissena polymorpha TaxID=45954 RepID=UPI0022651463|nr:neuropeptide S receptor-like [Dreissena polymorpha]
MAAVIISLNGLVIFILARQKDSNRLHFFIFHLAIAESTSASCHTASNEGLLPKARKKTIKMTLIICFSFFICWLPATVFHILDVFNISVLDSRFYLILQRLYPLNSAFNPIIFLLFNKHLLPCWSPKSADKTYESVRTTKTTL